MKKDVVVPLACLAGSIAMFFLLGTIEEERAKRFPEVVIAVMIVLSALLLLQNAFKAQMEKPAGKRFPWLRLGSLFGLIVVYFAALQPVGFYLSTFLFFVAVTLGFGFKELSGRKAVYRIFQSAIFTGVLFVLFKVLLEVQTPTGVFF